MTFNETLEPKIGSLFPKDFVCLEELDLNSDILSKIYERLLMLYEKEELTLQDFKSFRNKICQHTIAEIEPYVQLILAFLSVSRDELEYYAYEMNQIFSFSIFDERKKQVEVDPETERRKEFYIITSRDFQMGDIVTLSSSIYWKIHQMVEKKTSEYLREFLEIHELDSKEEQLNCYHHLLEKGSNLRKQWLEKILQSFDKDFFFLMRNKDFCDYFFTQRKNIDLYIKRSISKCIEKINKVHDKEIKNYTRDLIALRMSQETQKRGKGKGFGIWN